MKVLLFASVLALSVSAFAQTGGTTGSAAGKPMPKHDKEHHHVEASGDHDHDEAHHKDHDHKAHHPTHDKDAAKHGHDKDHKHTDSAKDHAHDEAHHKKEDTKKKMK